MTASALLLICSAVFLRSAMAAATTDPGFRTSDTIVVEINNEPTREAMVRAVAAEPAVASVAAAVYSVGANVYLPHLFSTYATRYGAIGAVFALISALFCVMLIVVASAAAGREVEDELDRIRRGERPAEDEVRRQWDTLTAEARARWKALRVRG